MLTKKQTSHLKSIMLVAALAIWLINPVQASKKVLNIQHWMTSQGTPVYFVATQSPEIVDIRLAFAAGSARDGKQWGLAALTNNMLAEGANNLSADEIAEQFSTTGAIYSHSLNRDMAILGLRSLNQGAPLQTALDTLTLIASQPDFPAAALSRTINRQIAAIDFGLQSPSDIATNTFYAKLYPNHPYGHPLLGDKTILTQLNPDDLKKFHRQYYTAQNAVISLVGTIDLHRAKAISEQISSALPDGDSAPALSQPQPIADALTENVNFPATQTNIRLGQLGMRYHAPQYFPLLVGNYMLGGGTLVSRLSNEVREKRGLSYAINSTFVPLATTGPFIIALGTAQAQTEQALQIVESTLKNYLIQGPSEAELQGAKAYLTGNFPLNLDSNSGIASLLLRMNFYQLPLDYLDTYTTKVNAVSLEEVKTSFNQLIDPNKLITIIVGET